MIDWWAWPTHIIFFLVSLLSITLDSLLNLVWLTEIHRPIGRTTLVIILLHFIVLSILLI